MYKLILIVCLISLASCVSVEKNSTSTAHGLTEVNDHTAIYIYPANVGMDRSFLPGFVNDAANLTSEKGYQRFLFYRLNEGGPRLEIEVFMFNQDSEIPLELRDFERFEAEEYRHKRYVPLGLYRQAS